jgi:hypothetical protein
MPTTINSSAVVTQWGSNYENTGQGMKDIRKQIKQPVVSENYITDISASENQIAKSVYVTMSELTQAYQEAFTPKGTVTFKPNEIILREIKADFEIKNLRELYNSKYLGFLKSSSLDYASHPFVGWFVSEYVLPQMEDDRELEMIHNGIYLTPTPGTAGLAKNSVNGFKKIIEDGITATTITPTATGAWETDPKLFVGQVNDWIENAIGRLNRRRLETVRLNETLFDRYTEGMEQLYNVNYPRLTEEKLSEVRLSGRASGIMLAGLPSMGDNERIWTTVKGNSVKRTRFADVGKTVMVWQTDPRIVKGFTEYELGYGFFVNELVFCNELNVKA